jgi:hypothetical protein
LDETVRAGDYLPDIAVDHATGAIYVVVLSKSTDDKAIRRTSTYFGHSLNDKSHFVETSSHKAAQHGIAAWRYWLRVILRVFSIFPPI